LPERANDTYLGFSIASPRNPHEVQFVAGFAFAGRETDTQNVT
jgi:hypothetical protein